jgi:hypothetical protein
VKTDFFEGAKLERAAPRDTYIISLRRGQRFFSKQESTEALGHAFSLYIYHVFVSKWGASVENFSAVLETFN